jgi:hypothetical protein
MIKLIAGLTAAVAAAVIGGVCICGCGCCC